MLDIKFVRNNPDVVKQNIKNKFQDEKLPLVDEVIELDQKNRDIKGEVEALRAEKNKISKQIGACMAQGKKEEAEEVLGRECDEVKQTFSGTIMPDEVADLFKVPHGTAALKIIRNYMDVRGRTIVASESFHTADRFSFSVAVKKKKY